MTMKTHGLFDAHFHIVDPRFPLVANAGYLPDLRAVTDAVPVLCIDHLGLSRTGFPHLLRLVERGAYVKATGFGRVDLPVEDALRAVARVNPNALLFGTDLPGTRAPKRFAPGDVERLCDALDDDALVRNALFENAARLYKKKPRSPGGRTAG